MKLYFYTGFVILVVINNISLRKILFRFWCINYHVEQLAKIQSDDSALWKRAVWGVMSMKGIFTLYFSYAFFAFWQANVGQNKPCRLVNESLSRFNWLFLMDLLQKFVVQKYSFFSNCLDYFQEACGRGTTLGPVTTCSLMQCLYRLSVLARN